MDYCTLLLSATLYATGIGRLWRRAGTGRGIATWQAGCYMAGWLVLVLALVSPIHRWGTGLFSIHMVEHELVMAAAAPLLALARPGGAFAWALPSRLRRGPSAALARATASSDTTARAGWAAAARKMSGLGSHRSARRDLR